MTRRILVVDDEPSLRRTLERALRNLAYEVATVGEPDLAYDLLESGGFDLVLLDVNLGQISGDTLFLALVRRAPELAHRVILMSGDPWAVKEDWPPDLQRCPLLTKPFSLEALAAIVAGALAEADAAAPRRKRNGG
ncbi:MAG TPA: response regulator [Gemmatimonadales bacterium]|nr:response regulator [Gemmatimonadales bacterium]